MFAKGRSNLQAGIDYDFEMLDYMLGIIPTLIQQSSEEIQKQIDIDAKENAGDDLEIQISISNNDCRNELLSLNYDIQRYFICVMTSMIYTFAESKLKQLSNETNKFKKPNKTTVEKFYQNILNTFCDLQPLDSIWPTFKEFNNYRNKITHELFDDRVRFINDVEKDPTGIVSMEKLETNLKQVHQMLRGIADRITEREQHM